MDQNKDILHYLAVLKTRKKFFILPAVVIFTVTVIIASVLPKVYESTSTILIEEQQIPPEFVKSTITGFADQRIQSLTQQILSRTKLWEIIQQFHLYPELQKKATREDIIDTMRHSIRLDTISAEVGDRPRPRGGGAHGSGITIAFSISYLGKNPETVQKVASTLASLYLEQNLKIREAQAKTTTQFLEAELKELQERIRVLGEKITNFKKKHEGMTPDLYQFNLGQADRLENELKQLDNAIRTAEDRKIYLEGQLTTVNPDASGSGEKAMDPKARLKSLDVALADLQSKFSDDHPDIRKLQREKAQLEKLVGGKGGSASFRRQKLTQLQAELAQKQGKYSDEHPDVRKLKGEIALLEQEPEKASAPKPVTEPENPAYISLTTQVQAATNEIASMQRQRAALKEKVQMYHRRLEQTPQLEQEFLALQRDYNNSHTKYQEVLNKILEARISEGMEEHQKGEKFTIMDPANFPGSPIKPKRLLIILAGLVFSLVAGLGTVVLVEQVDHSVKTADELYWLTDLPVLGAIAQIRTREDVARSLRKRRLIWTVSGLSLALGLVCIHFFYTDLWIITSRLLRFVGKYI